MRIHWSADGQWIGAPAAAGVSAVGGFCKGDATLLVGIADENVGPALETTRANCQTRTVFVNRFPLCRL